MLQYLRVGELIGGDPDRPQLLPPDRPLSYLRAEDASRGTVGLTRALLESPWLVVILLAFRAIRSIR